MYPDKANDSTNEETIGNLALGSVSIEDGQFASIAQSVRGSPKRPRGVRMQSTWFESRCSQSKESLMKLFLSFKVLGAAQPTGSKSSFVPKNKKTGQPFTGPGGRIVVNTVDSNPKSKDWKKRVGQAAQEAMELAGLKAPADGPLKLVLRFHRTRPKGHFGSGKNADILKLSSPQYPETKPDVLKTARAIEDAMSKIVYRDDSQIVREILSKDFALQDSCEIEVWTM